MERFKPYSAVVAALRDSKVLTIVGDEEGKEMVKRQVAYDSKAANLSKQVARSVYAKGFGDEKPSSQFDIEAYFAEFGPTNNVKLRRTGEKLFKGSVFVEFADEETAKKFLALDPKPTWEGHPLKTETKQEYMDRKDEEIKAGILAPNESWAPRGRGGRGRANNSRGRNDRNDRGRGDRKGGDRDPDDWKKRREDDRATGFKDRRGDHKGNSRGRGGRGGRNDRGSRNNDRSGRPNDRNREREGKNGSKTDELKTEAASSTEKSADVVEKVEGVAETATVNEKKRAREDDGAEEKPAKKADTKSEVPATA